MRRVLPIFMVLCLILGGPMRAGVAPARPEFRVNTHTTSHQRRPSVAMRGSGGFVVVWDSRYQDGSYYGIFGQMFDSAGAPVAAEFQVNTYTTSFQDSPSVAVSGSGEFVVVWESAQDGSGMGVFGQMFDSGGTPVAAEFQVNTYTTFFQYSPSVAMSASGEFVVAWSSLLQDGSGMGVFGQMFDSAGTRVGAEFQVNTYTTSFQDSPSVAVSGSGEFVIVWRSSAQDGSDAGVFGQMFDSGGTPVAAEFQVNTHTTYDQEEPSVAMTGSGEFVVMWSSYDQDGSYPGVFGQVFDNAGAPVGAEFQVNTYTTSHQYHPSVGMSGSGEFVVAWDSYGQDGPDFGIFAQRGVTNGPRITSPSPGGTMDCSDPALIRPTFTWDTGDYDKFKVFMGSSRGFETGTRVTSGDQKIVTGSWSPSKKKWKSACNKAITQAADPNSPVMYVAVEGRDTGLPKSDPLRKLLSFPVRTSVQP